MFLFYPILFCCLLATRPVWAEWQGNPPLKNEYNEHEFLAACREGNVPAVEFYLADDDFAPNTYLRSGISRDMTTGLYIAAKNGQDEVVQILADDERVDLNQTEDGATSVFIASQNGHDKVVQIFADTERVDLNRTWRGKTPVYIASQCGHDKVVEILAHTEGVNLNQTYDGATPVFIASQNNHDKVVQILIDVGADPTIKWRHSWGIFSKTPRTIATDKRFFIRKRNSEKYAVYSRIIKNLRLAEQQWKQKNAMPVTPVDDRNYSHWDDSESIYLLHHVRRLSVTGACQ